MDQVMSCWNCVLYYTKYFVFDFWHFEVGLSCFVLQLILTIILISIPPEDVRKLVFFFQMFSEVINRNGCWAKMVGVIVEFFQGERFLNNLLLQTISSQCFLLLLPPTTWSTLSFLMYSRGEWYQKETVRSYGLIKCNGNVTPILLREKSHSQVFTSGAGTRCVL